MLSGFFDFISKENLCAPTDRILLAVSGGMDSMVMARLFSKAEFDFGIAHCNFMLRGNESDEDELFVQQLAETYNVPFYSVQFPTEKYARENKISVQMAARNLRYEWFDELCRDENYSFVATAHHLDDSIETFFINLLRGCGIRGLAGISSRSGNIIRPLLFASRTEIENFINKEEIPYREDSSNQDTKYLRNKIRHNILPLFENENPSFRENLGSTMDHLNNALGIYNQLVKEKQNSLISRKGQQAFIMLRDLESLDPIRTWTFELLQPFGFNYSTCCDIIESLSGQSGKSFYSDSHRIIKDREQLIISPRLTDETNTIYKIERSEKKITIPVKMSFEVVELNRSYKISTDQNIAQLDYNKISYPLILRKWQQGDHFFPLGMQQKKKLSDFFIDQKFSIDQKEDTWVLCSGEDIIWIAGHRIDDRYKITSSSKNILIINLQSDKS